MDLYSVACDNLGVNDDRDDKYDIMEDLELEIENKVIRLYTMLAKKYGMQSGDMTVEQELMTEKFICSLIDWVNNNGGIENGN